MIFRGNRPRFCPRLKQREGKGQERCFRVFHIRRRRKSMNHRSVVWTRPKAKSPRALAGSWIVTGRHTSPVTRSLLSSPSQPCARAHKVSSVNNLTRRIFHRFTISRFLIDRSIVIDPERVRLKLMMFSGKLKRESRLIVENERLKFLTSLFRASSRWCIRSY